MSANPHEVPEQQQAQEEMISMLATSAADFCKRALPVTRLRGLRDTNAEYDPQLWREMAELGWFGVLVNESCGGLQLGINGASVLCRALGQVAAPEPLIETLASAALLNQAQIGTDLLDSLICGEKTVITALGTLEQEPFDIVTANSAGEKFTLHGTLSGVSIGNQADAFIVPGKRDGIAGCWLVGKNTDKLAIESRLLADGNKAGHVLLNGCEARLLSLGENVREAFMRARATADIAASAYQLGLAESMLAMTIDYTSTREQFGQAIGSFQSLQHRLVNCYIALRLTDACVSECASAADACEDTNLVLPIASRAAYRAAETLSLISREAIQLHGAIGYTDDCDVGIFVNRGITVAARFGRATGHLARFAKLQAGINNSDVTASDTATVSSDMTPANNDWNALDNDTFRAVVHQWHRENYPEELKNLNRRVRWHQCRHWYEKLYHRGFAAPGWPSQHGGMGLTPEKLLIFIEERERLGIARTPDQGIIMVGPLLMKYGTREQQAHYLPKALSGEHIWCQGYSEPNAGSDLASLRTTAVRDGDEFIVNGQKIWTTLAQDANQMFCLVRTDANVKPQAGISFILIDFATPGITVRPIKNIGGDEEFCEVFLEDVRVPCKNLVGELNNGWTIAKALLGFERFFIGSPKNCRSSLARAAELIHARNLSDDPVTTHRYTQFSLDVDALESLYKEFADQIRRGEIPGADISILKIFASETFQSLSEFILDLGAEGGAQVDGVDFDDNKIDALHNWYAARPTTVYGGSNEIQRNILAKAVMRLPSR